ncbi:MAG: LPXTG cell wall anchor domain-containing protein [Candidatus Nanoarchaeia archaeon]
MKKVLFVILSVFLVSLVGVFATPPQTCDDSDGGNLPYTAGTVTWSTPEHTDYFPDTCVANPQGKVQLQEHYCEGVQKKVDVIDCNYCYTNAQGEGYCADNEIPEFSAVAAGLALAGAGAGFIFLRKKK